MADTGYVVKTETTCSPDELMYVRTECPECKVLREQLAKVIEQREMWAIRAESHCQRNVAAEREVAAAQKLCESLRAALREMLEVAVPVEENDE